MSLAQGARKPSRTIEPGVLGPAMARAIPSEMSNVAQPSAPPPSSVNAGSDGDMAELRMRQAEFHRTLGDLDRQNSWLAIAALAPIAATLGLEGLAARSIGTAVAEGGPLNFPTRERFRRVGDLYEAKVGRRAHKDLERKIDQKPDWGYNKQWPAKSGGYLKPDVTTPRGRLMELKPDTPPGRRAAAAAVRKYERELEKKVRAIFYNPKDYR